jgi:hypothetical protein
MERFGGLEASKAQGRDGPHNQCSGWVGSCWAARANMICLSR